MMETRRMGEGLTVEFREQSSAVPRAPRKKYRRLKEIDI
jgi:hypothetical protein